MVDGHLKDPIRIKNDQDQEDECDDKKKQAHRGRESAHL